MCDRGFCTKVSPVVHLKAKHGINTYYCDVCDNRLFTKNALVDHLKAKHGITEINWFIRKKKLV